MTSDIIQITPSYPPEISGVGDYASIMNNVFHCHGNQLRTLVLGNSTVSEAEVVKPDESSLVKALENVKTVFLHFSGYGYARWGLCRWLVRGLRRWLTSNRSAKLITMFHEAYATGSFWQTSFWVSPFQKSIARELATISNTVFVSSPGGRDELLNVCPDADVEILGVFSNVGECDEPSPLARRAPHAVIFGGRDRRAQVYQALSEQSVSARSLFDALGVERIIDMGPQIDAPRSIGGVDVETRGVRSPAEISNALAKGRLGILNYPRHKISKSGIAAAYFAHGMLVVNTGKSGKYDNSMLVGSNLIEFKEPFPDLFRAQDIATSGWTGYQSNRMSIVLQKLEGALFLGAVNFDRQI